MTILCKRFNIKQDDLFYSEKRWYKKLDGQYFHYKSDR